jgi:hypothetical protein
MFSVPLRVEGMGKITDKKRPGRAWVFVKIRPPIRDALLSGKPGEKTFAELRKPFDDASRKAKDAAYVSLTHPRLRHRVDLLDRPDHMPDDPWQRIRWDGKSLDRTPRRFAQIALDFDQFSALRVVSIIESVADNEGHGAKRTATPLFGLA